LTLTRSLFGSPAHAIVVPLLRSSSPLLKAPMTLSPNYIFLPLFHEFFVASGPVGTAHFIFFDMRPLNVILQTGFLLSRSFSPSVLSSAFFLCTEPFLFWVGGQLWRLFSAARPFLPEKAPFFPTARPVHLRPPSLDTMTKTTLPFTPDFSRPSLQVGNVPPPLTYALGPCLSPFPFSPLFMSL